MTVARLSGRLAGGSTGPGGPFLVAGLCFGWSDGMRHRVDALPGGGDLFGPGPGRGDLEGSAAAAADEAGGGVQEAVAQGLRLRFREIAVEGGELQPGQQDAGGHRRVEPGLVDRVVVRGEVAQAGVLAGADDILDAGVDAVGGVGVGALAAPASGVSGQVGRPQGVAPAVGRLEQGQLGAGVGPLAAGEDAHPLGPAVELVAAGSLAQQPGQLGDVRFFYPAGGVGASRVLAGAVGPALADPAFPVDRGLPGGLRDLADRVPLTGAERPADRVCDLVTVPGGQPVKLFDQLVAGPGSVAGDHDPAAQPGRERGDRLAEQPQVISGRVAAGRAGTEHPGQRLARVIAGREQWMMPVAFEVRFRQFLVAVRLHDGRVQADARHALQDPVRNPDRRQRPGLRPHMPPRLVHRGGELAAGPLAAGRGLLQRPPRRRDRRDRAEDLLLVGHHPEITDHPGPVRDRARQVGEHASPGMAARRRRQRRRQARRQTAPVRQLTQQHQPRMRHDPRAASRHFKTARPSGSVHVESAP